MKDTLTVVIYRSKSVNPNQRWRWKAVAPNGRKVASSGEGYRDKGHAENMARALLDHPRDGSKFPASGVQAPAYSEVKFEVQS